MLTSQVGLVGVGVGAQTRGLQTLGEQMQLSCVCEDRKGLNAGRWLSTGTPKRAVAWLTPGHLHPFSFHSRSLVGTHLRLRPGKRQCELGV